MTLFAAAISFFVFANCKKETTETKEVLLRIENLTLNKFDSVVIDNPSGMQRYYNISSGSKSAYKKLDYIYNYAYIKAYYNNKIVVLQPIDYVGETKLENGQYTYQLAIVSTAVSNYLTVQNQKD